MKTVIGKHFNFEASHLLPEKECYGKCRHLHGHRYELEVQIEGEIDEEGWICNFSDVRSLVKKHVLDKYDHQHLNDYFPIPTAENIALAIYRVLDNALREKNYHLHKIRLYETANSYAEVKSEK